MNDGSVLNAASNYNIWGSGGISPHILNPGCISYPLDERMSGPESQSGHFGKKKRNLLLCPETNADSSVVQPHSLVSIPEVLKILLQSPIKYFCKTLGTKNCFWVLVFNLKPYMWEGILNWLCILRNSTYVMQWANLVAGHKCHIYS
jgi:hypothetical protein